MSRVCPKLTVVTTRSDDLFAFFGAVVRRPQVIGAIAPSAEPLCRELAEIVPTDAASVVVELGPGTGAVSRAISQRLSNGSRHVAIEIDPRLATRLRHRHPDIEVVTGDAGDLAKILADLGIHQVDALVSGLPWSLIPPAHQQQIITQAAGVLAPGAAFTTFAYLHARHLSRARQLRRLLHASFDEMLTTRSLWWNAPPALTYVCRRPRQT